MKQIAIDYKTLGKTIKVKRLEGNITQEKLAEKVNLSPTHISNIENGKTKVSLESLVLIADYFSCSVDSLLDNSIDNSKSFYDRTFCEFLSNCTLEEKKFLIEITKQIKKSYDRLLKPLL